MKKIASLSIIEDLKNNKVLMIKHLRGINAGYFNFPGGKKEEEETIEDCVRRETLEETGLTILNPEKVGYVEFPSADYYVHIFKSTEFEGDIKAKKDEVEVFWQNLDKIPYDKMRKTDKDFLTDIFAGKYVQKRYVFDEDSKLINIVNLNTTEIEKKSR